MTLHLSPRRMRFWNEQRCEWWREGGVLPRVIWAIFDFVFNHCARVTETNDMSLYKFFISLMVWKIEFPAILPHCQQYARASQREALLFVENILCWIVFVITDTIFLHTQTESRVVRWKNGCERTHFCSCEFLSPSPIGWDISQDLGHSWSSDNVWWSCGSVVLDGGSTWLALCSSCPAYLREVHSRRDIF